MLDAVVIGGGVSGLTLAYRLKKAGRSFVLIESRRVGGALKTVKKDGFIVEQGSIVYNETKEMASLIDELNLRSEVVYSSLRKEKSFIWSDDKIVSVPESLGGLLGSSALFFTDKISFLWKMITLNPSKLKKGEQDTIGTLCRRLAGDKLYNRLIKPSCRGVFGLDVEGASPNVFHPDFWRYLAKGGRLTRYFRKRKKTPVIVLKRGNEILSEKLIQHLRSREIVSDRGVSIVPSLDRTWFTVKTLSGTSYCARSVYVAVSARDAAPLVQNFAPDFSTALQKMRYSSLSVVSCAVDKEFALPKNGSELIFPETEGSQLLGIVFNSTMFPHTAPEDKHLFTVYLGGVDHETALDASQRTVSEIVCSELKKRFHIYNVDILSVQKWRNAIPQPDPCIVNIQKERRKLAVFLPGLYFSGLDRAYAGVSDKIAAADRVLDIASNY